MSTGTGRNIKKYINTNNKRVTTQGDFASNTTFADITGLSVKLRAGGVYRIKGLLPVTSGASGGAKIQLTTADGLTITSGTVVTEFINSAATTAVVTTTTALNTAMGATQVLTAIRIDAVIRVNAAGTLKIQGAQNASNGTTTSFLVDGTLEIIGVTN